MAPQARHEQLSPHSLQQERCISPADARSLHGLWYRPDAEVHM